MRKRVRIVCALACAWTLAAGAASGQLVTPEEIAQLQSLKRLVYTGLTRAHAMDVAAGTAQPLVNAQMGDDLPISWFHYRVPADRVEALAAEIALPPGFSLAPITIVRRTRPDHYVSLGVYESTGERSGLRAEWTTYVVRDGDPKPRVMVLEVWASEEELNPVDLLADPVDAFEYTSVNGLVTAEIASGTASFSASFRIPRRPRSVMVDSGWSAASDVVYWSNGVADLVNVNPLVSNRRLASLPVHRVQIDNQSAWAAFVEPDPQWVLLFDEPIGTAIRPWFNATDPSLPLDPDFRDELLETKATAFSAIELERSAAINAGTAEPVADFFVEQNPPSIFLNFAILPDQLQALADAIPLPEGFALARVRPLRAGPSRHYLSLNIYETVGVASGLRAEWSVYVTREGDPLPRYMILEAQSSTPSLDPVDRFTPPADVFEYGVEDGVISVDVQAPGTSFQAAIPLGGRLRRRATTLDWTEANNLIYWRNGVADRIFYSGLVYDTKMIQVPKTLVSISDGSAWAPYLSLEQVLVFENPLEFIASPWANLDQLEAEAASR